MAQLVIQQARDTAAHVEKHAQDVLRDAKTEARDVTRRAEEQAARHITEAKDFAEHLLEAARKNCEQEKGLASEWALQTRTAGEAELVAARRQIAAEKGLLEKELAQLRAQVDEYRREAATAYEGAMKARETIDEAARKEFAARTQELTNLQSVVQTTTDLAKTVIKPAEPKTTATEVIGGVITQFIQSAQGVVEKALDRSENVQKLVGDIADKGRARIQGTPRADDTEAGAGSRPTTGATAPPSHNSAHQADAEAEVDRELLREIHAMRPDQVPEEYLMRVCTEKYGDDDLTKLTFLDVHAAAFMWLADQRKKGPAS